MSTKPPYTVTAAALLLGKSRQWISTVINREGIGQRVAPSVVLLSAADIKRIRATIMKKKSAGKFLPGNDLHTLRKKPGRKKAVNPKS